MKSILLLVVFLALSLVQVTPAVGDGIPKNRVASLFISEDFLNQQLALHSKSDLVKDMKIELDYEHSQIFLRGRIQVPVEELRAVNLEPKLGSFRFQVTIKPEITKEGYLILDFPLSETYFYPAVSTDPKNDRIIIPVQMISLALASIRGYMAALSGDFSGFDRRTAKLDALVKALDRSIAQEKNADALEELKVQRESLRVQLEAVPIERKQLQGLAKEYEHIMGFTGEKELNINDELGARKNALILKIKLSQLAPFLQGVEIGGLRMLLDKKDGGGEKYFAIDINSQLAVSSTPASGKSAKPREAIKSAPALILRMDQSLFESDAVLVAEKKDMSSSIKDIAFALMDDGLHVSGHAHKLLFTVPFEAVVDFVPTGVDQFEVRMRKMDVAGINVEFLSKFVLESMKKRLDAALKGLCTFKYVGEEGDQSRALQVTVTPQLLVPAFPDLHLVSVDVREHEFLMKIGRP